MSNADDRNAISDALAEYAYRWDRKDAAGVAALFTEDGAMTWVIGGEPVDQKVSGRAAIEAYSRTAHTERIGDRQSRHFFSNLVFRELAGDHAVTENMLLVTHQSPGAAVEVKTTGVYRIEWAKVGDTWLIADRALSVDR